MKKTIFLVPMLMLSTLPMLAGCTKKCTLTIINNDPDMGEVSGGGTFKKGTQVAVSATPFETYSFYTWEYDSNKSSRANYHFIIEKDTTIYANFEHSTYSIEVTNSNDFNTFCGELNDERKCKWGETTKLEVNAYSGYKVDQWIDNSNDEVLDEGNLFDIEMPTRDLSVRCTFKENTLFFGNYPQDKVTDIALINSLKSIDQTPKAYLQYDGNEYYCLDGDSYFSVSPIEWDIVKDENDYTLLISKNVLFGYTMTEQDCLSYKNSGFRSYLNGEFINNAFTDEERTKIQLNNIYAEDFEIINDYIFIPCQSSKNNYYYNERLAYKYTFNTDLANAMGITKESYYSTNYIYFLCYYPSLSSENPSGKAIYYDVYYRYGCCGINEGSTYGIRPMIQISK